MVAQNEQRRAALPPERAHAPLSAFDVPRVAFRKLEAGKVVVMADVLRQTWERDCATYLQWLVDEHCKGCLRKSSCDICDISRARVLIDRYSAIRQMQPADVPHKANMLGIRYREILSILRRADKPLRTREIHLRSTVSRNVKWWTLRRMLTKGLIRKTRVKNIYGRYEVAYYTQKGKQQ